MIAAPLVVAVPSKGRLKDQVEAWFRECGLAVTGLGTARGYLARIDGFDDIQVRLASAADIATALVGGEVHLGITGQDLLAETADGLDPEVLLLMALGFGRADLVVAAPKSWIDVETMADLDDVARRYLARTGRRLRVATKYRRQTRAFFARHGLADYRLVDSAGATEGAPAAGTAELVVDITSSGATLAANGLKPVIDGLILSSQARLAASLRAQWTALGLASARRLLRILEARARGASHASLTWPAEQNAVALAAMATLLLEPAVLGAGALIPTEHLFAAADALSAADVGPVAVARATYIFEAASAAGDKLGAALNLRSMGPLRPRPGRAKTTIGTGP